MRGLSRPRPAIVLPPDLRLRQRAVRRRLAWLSPPHPAIRANGLPFLIVGVGLWTLTGTLAAFPNRRPIEPEADPILSVAGRPLSYLRLTGLSRVCSGVVMGGKTTPVMGRVYEASSGCRNDCRQGNKDALPLAAQRARGNSCGGYGWTQDLGLYKRFHEGPVRLLSVNNVLSSPGNVQSSSLTT